MRVLLIKLSSLGDVIHALPAVTEACAKVSGLVFDWMVEEDFSCIPGWHPGVEEVIPAAQRRWRRKPLATLSSLEWKEFKAVLRHHCYDHVIDAQGLLKSAWMTRYVATPAAGYDWRSARESLASLFYRRRVRVPWSMHAVERIRQLFSAVLSYQLASQPPGYGLEAGRFGSPRPARAVVLAHGTTRQSKMWPTAHWRSLCRRIAEAGHPVQIPWHDKMEWQRASFIAAAHRRVELLPRLELSGIVNVLARAGAVVAVDSGLGHMAAALGRPVVSLYGMTNPEQIGTWGSAPRIHLQAPDPQQMESLQVEWVWESLRRLLAN